jgi:hypothetical protein
MFPLSAKDVEDLSRQCPWNVVRIGYNCDNRHHRVEGNAIGVFGGMSFDVAPPSVFPSADVTLSYSVFVPSCFGAEKVKLPGLLIGDRPFCVESDVAKDRWVAVAVRVKVHAMGVLAVTIDGRTRAEFLRTDPNTLVTAARIETTSHKKDGVVVLKDFSLSLRSESLRAHSPGAAGHRGHEPVAPEPMEGVDYEVDDRRYEAEYAPEQAVAVALVRDAGDPEVEHEVQEPEEEA